MQLGQPKHLKGAQGDGGGLMRVRLDEGDNVHRILYGPVKISLQYYPVLIEDDTSGEMVQRMKVIRRDNSVGTPLDVLASLEKRVRRERGEPNPSSSLNPSTKWLYKVIDRNDPEYPAVKIVEYPYTVYKPLEELEASVSTKDASRLMYGLIFMWDAIISKNIDKSKGIRFGTSYSVKVDPENTYAGKVPASYLGATTDELVKHGLKLSKFFTDEEWAAVEEDAESGTGLEEIGKPETTEEIAEKLRQFPIFLGATNQDGSYRFPSVEQFKEQLTKQGLDFLEGTDQEKPKAQRLTASTTTEDSKKEVVFEEDAEETVAEGAEEAEVVKEESKTTEEDADEDFPEW
jgi:hypothetical protein